MLQAVNAAALMERTHFAIDDAKDDDEDDDEDDILDGHDHDDEVMDEVLHPSYRFKNEDFDCFCCRSMRSLKRMIRD